MDRFPETLETTKKRPLMCADARRIFNINCWNEWTEGSYLDPDRANGLDRLRNDPRFTVIGS